MEKIYFDISEKTDCISLFSTDVQIIPAGTTVYTMSVKDKNAHYQNFADRHDIHFIFEDNVPKINFFAVPRVDIFAVDSIGGVFGTIGETTDLGSAAPICYINKSHTCFRVANSLSEWMQLLASFPNHQAALTRCNEVVLYQSREDAQKTLEFFNPLPNA